MAPRPRTSLSVALAIVIAGCAAGSDGDSSVEQSEHPNSVCGSTSPVADASSGFVLHRR